MLRKTTISGTLVLGFYADDFSILGLMGHDALIQSYFHIYCRCLIARKYQRVTRNGPFHVASQKYF